MSAFVVWPLTVTLTDIPLKLVDWKAAGAIVRFAGPSPVPLTMKMLPGAMSEDPDSVC
jgi:hypothetical protein